VVLLQFSIWALKSFLQIWCNGFIFQKGFIAWHKGIDPNWNFRISCLIRPTEELFKKARFYGVQSNHFGKVSLSFGESRGEEKTFAFKRRVFNVLKSKLKKHQKKVDKKLELDNKGGTFAPATTNKFFNKLSKWSTGNRCLLKEKRGRKFSLKTFKKHLRDWKEVVLLHPLPETRSDCESNETRNKIRTRS